ncbi:MAG: hypothetical protein PUB18_03150 [bacterium]|nr:hypothetical protein [bacterium]
MENIFVIHLTMNILTTLLKELMMLLNKLNMLAVVIKSSNI